MKKLQLALKLSKLSDITHIWFPCPIYEDKKTFDISVTQMQTDKFGNKIAYFKLEKVNKIEIQAQFAVSSCQVARNICKADNFLASSKSVQANDKQIIKIVNDITKDKKNWFQNSVSVIARSRRRGNLKLNQIPTPSQTWLGMTFETGSKLDKEMARTYFNWVVSHLEYANPIPGLYSALQALTDRQVDCGGFATLLTALLRAVKIPARCVFGWAIKSKSGYHAWTEYFNRQKQKWIPIDPSVANLGKRTKLNAGFGFINDERTVLSVGEDIELSGSNGFAWSTPLLQSPVVVSINEEKIPQPIIENLKWKVK